MSQQQPIIGIAGDVDIAPGGDAAAPPALRSCCRMTYIDAVARAGGRPVVLPPLADHIEAQLALVQGVLLIGGDDPRTEPFGRPTDPRTTPVQPLRQAYDTALLRALEHHPAKPVLGVCYGMQMMALTAGGTLHQHLPDLLGEAWRHHWDQAHAIEAHKGSPDWLQDGMGHLPFSRHRQAVAEAGTLHVIGASKDGIVEAIGDPRRHFYVGVQWHPERSGNGPLGSGVYSVFVRACRG